MGTGGKRGTEKEITMTDKFMQEAGIHWKMYTGARAEMAASYLHMGERLLKARGKTGHGEWMERLRRVGIPYHTARRAMRLHEAGIKIDTVSTLGVRKCLELMAGGDEKEHEFSGKSVNFIAELVAQCRPEPEGETAEDTEEILERAFMARIHKAA